MTLNTAELRPLLNAAINRNPQAETLVCTALATSGRKIVTELEDRIAGGFLAVDMSYDNTGLRNALDNDTRISVRSDKTGVDYVLVINKLGYDGTGRHTEFHATIVRIGTDRPEGTDLPRDFRRPVTIGRGSNDTLCVLPGWRS